MNAYLKGGIVAAILIAGMLYWYQTHQGSLPVNQSPSEFKILDEMEKHGVPDFTANRLDGSPVKLSDFKGKLVIVNFWASWCNPCVEEFPSMLKLVEALKGDVIILAISGDDHKADIQTFLKAFSMPKPFFEVTWDQDRSLMQKFGVEKLPESFIVGKDGKLLRKVAGSENWSTPEAIEFFKSLSSGASVGAAAVHANGGK